ncbi:hypothetical protein NWO28_05040 [Enterococcus faecalis]|nr:hypothetical protein [Enterococcus faecalis]
MGETKTWRYSLSRYFIQLPYLPHAELTAIWGHGLIKINKIDIDSAENRGRYVSKYFDKDLELKEHKKKAFFKSQNLKHPLEIKRLTDRPYEVKDQKVLFTNNYVSKRPVFFQDWNEQNIPNKEIGFEEQNVRYTKIKKNGGTHK